MKNIPRRNFFSATYVFFDWISHSHLFNKLVEIHTTFICAYIPSYSLTNSQAHSSNYAHLCNARSTG